MSELVLDQNTNENEQKVYDLQDKYGLPDTSAVVLSVIEANLDTGSGIHKGGFIDNADVTDVQIGQGANVDRDAVESVATRSYSENGAEPVFTYEDPRLAQLPIEKARESAFAGLAYGSTLKGTDTRMSFVVMDDKSPKPDRDMSQDKRGVYEKTMFMANGAVNPDVVECVSIYKQAENATSGFGKLQDFTMTRRPASAAEIADYYALKNAEQ